METARPTRVGGADACWDAPFHPRRAAQSACTQDLGTSEPRPDPSPAPRRQSVRRPSPGLPHRAVLTGTPKLSTWRRGTGAPKLTLGE